MENQNLAKIILVINHVFDKRIEVLKTTSTLISGKNDFEQRHEEIDFIRSEINSALSRFIVPNYVFVPDNAEVV